MKTAAKSMLSWKVVVGLVVGILGATSFGGVAHAQGLMTTQVALATGGILTMQLTKTGVQQLNGDAYDAYLNLDGIPGENTTKRSPLAVEAVPLTAGGSSRYAVIAAALLGSVAVSTQSTTVDAAKLAAAQIAHAQLVFTGQPPTTPMTATQAQAMVSLAMGFLTLAGGSPPIIDGPSITAQLLEAFNLLTICTPAP